MNKPIILNLENKTPIILVEYLKKTKELQISTDGAALQTELVEKDIQWLLVISQLLIKAGNQYIQEYIDQKKLQDSKSKKLIDNLSN